MAFEEYESYDALGLGALIAAREVSAPEVLEAAIGRIKAIVKTPLIGIPCAFATTRQHGDGGCDNDEDKYSH
ncbi:MAG: hypothetical protein IH905_18075 [Proteobacteria bacterium]|nr:hypothetical protein [Pseudomonadota bacterium]